MKILPQGVDGTAVVALEPSRDERGSFARAWDAAIFAEHGLETGLAQMNLSTNRHAGTLRGLHYQTAPHAEAKFFRCIVGRTFHVGVDLRPESATYLRWTGVELDAESSHGFFLPAGCAAGYQALTDDAAVLYCASTPYAPGAEQGLRWDDPAIGIEWPLPELARQLVSPKDAAWPLLRLTDRPSPTEPAVRRNS